VALNDKQVIHAKPKQKPYKLGDSGGFYLYVLVSGFTSWRFKCRFAGKEKRLICASCAWAIFLAPEKLFSSL